MLTKNFNLNYKIITLITLTAEQIINVCYSKGVFQELK